MQTLGKKLWPLAIFYSMVPSLWGQQTVDSSFVQEFEKPNVIEWNTGTYGTGFNFRSYGNRTGDFRLAANSNAFTGVYLNYKWVSLSYYWAIPGTELSRNIRLKQTSFSFRFNRNRFSLIPFYRFYNGLLLENRKNKRAFNAFRNMQVNDAGVRLFYYSNPSKYSYKAGSSFSERQLKSAGGVILMAVPEWQHINWKSPSHALVKDSATYRLLASDPQWASVLLGVGYNHNFVLMKGRWVFSPAIILGAGLLKETNNRNPVQRLFNLQAAMTAGYSGDLLYGYVNANWQWSQTHLIVKKLNVLDHGISLTVGYRFKNLPKKILGLL